MSLQYSECRSCKAKVAWIDIEDSPKKQIVDAQPLFLYALQPGGKFKLVQCFRSHFVSCPDAEKWRKKKEAGNVS